MTLVLTRASKQATVSLVSERNTFVITGERANGACMYRATLPACACERKACVRRHETWDGKHSREFCHRMYGYHVEHATALVERVLRSYGALDPTTIQGRHGRILVRPLLALAHKVVKP